MSKYDFVFETISVDEMISKIMSRKMGRMEGKENKVDTRRVSRVLSHGWVPPPPRDPFDALRHACRILGAPFDHQHVFWYNEGPCRYSIMVDPIHTLTLDISNQKLTYMNGYTVIHSVPSLRNYESIEKSANQLRQLIIDNPIEKLHFFDID